MLRESLTTPALTNSYQCTTVLWETFWKKTYRRTSVETFICITRSTNPGQGLCTLLGGNWPLEPTKIQRDSKTELPELQLQRFCRTLLLGTTRLLLFWRARMEDLVH